MADLQKYFIEFHDDIKLTDENEELREKRDIILKKLAQRKADEVAIYTTFNQGSYAMNTGVKPVNGDYDIDVGIKFDINKDDYEDPIKVKEWVYNALVGHTRKVEVRRPCVTVTYQIDGEPAYHVDLAIYSANNSDNKMYIAKGKQNSTKEYRKWEVSDPQTLINLISNKYDDNKDREQFRRVIRYLKRWRDLKFTDSGNSKPNGIGLTIAAYNLFEINKTTDYFANKTTYNDIEAMKTLVKKIINSFSYEYRVEEMKFVYRLHVNLLIEPYNDTFEKMTDIQMEDFKSKLETLRDKLNEASLEFDPHEACKILAEEFGDDFPIPEKADTADKKRNSFITSSSSAK